jgi:heat shock protein HslJ
MRRITLAAVMLAVAAIVMACSSGSSLTGKVWNLTSITEKTPAFQGVVPEADKGKYTIEFQSDGKFNSKADCNQVAGAYTTTSTGGMTITPGPSTLVACPEGSFGDQYVAGLGNAASYAIASNVLTITLKDGGTLVYN